MNKIAPGKKSVRAAARAYKATQEPTTFSHFHTEIRGADGKLKWSDSRPGYRHNLTTDTASGYTNRRDWQSKAMGGGLPPTATMTGNLTAISATTATNSGAAFPTAGQALSGCIVVVGPRATSSSGDAIAFGVIVSNTATVLTIDRWYSGGTWGAGTTPNATGAYTVLPGQMPAMFLAVTSDATSPTAADTTLASEATTNGFARALATYAHTAAATTYTLQVVFTASGSLTVNTEAVFAAANPTAGGAMPFKSAEPSPPVLISGDTLTQTVTVTIN